MPPPSARRSVPAAVFIPASAEPAPVVAPGWWRNDKALVLDFRAPPGPAVHDDEEIL